jgi:hypothetical protein
MTTGIWAKSILASEHSITGKRLDTFLVRMPRCILAEWNTHRVFSRNAASSRAIPVHKMIKQVMNDPFIPVKWTKNQPGMQGYEELSGTSLDAAKTIWFDALYDALDSAKKLAAIRVHKQIVNRLLEPWMFTIVCVSATEWDNFFALRNHHAAEPHIQLVAQAIFRAREEAEVQILKPGEWHLPWITIEDKKFFNLDNQKIISVARSASTSYKTIDDFKMTPDKALNIYNKMMGPPIHASPFEHCACADEVNIKDNIEWWAHPEEHRNFIGFRQLRAQIEAVV